MTEQNYDKQVEAGAIKHGEYRCTNHDVPEVFTARNEAAERHFLAGVKWARENPPPEVQELVKALEYCSIEPGFLHPQNNSQQCAAVNALAIFKNRGK